MHPLADASEKDLTATISPIITEFGPMRNGVPAMSHGLPLAKGGSRS